MSLAGRLLFIIGLGASYRIRLIGLIGVSEVLVFLWAPLIFSNEYPFLRRNGFGTLLTLIFMTMIGCVVSSVANHTQFAYFCRGFAQIYSLFSGVVVIHNLLRKDPKSIKWLALGLGLGPLLVFLLQGGDLNLEFEMATGGSSAFTRMRVLADLIRIPVAGWYYNLPLWCSTVAPFVFGAVCLIRSASGRSLAMMLMGTGLLAFVVRRQNKRLLLISKHFIRFSIGIAVFLLVFKATYSYLAPRGYLGEVARAKYEFQTQGGKGIISVLMGGRPQVFAGIYVALKKPIIGFGPWARDKEGYEAEFYEHYASEYARALRSRERKMQYGKFHVLGGHSHMISFWTWFGIFGLIFWIYVLVMVFRLFKTNISAMPVFFGFICAYVPAHVWHILFSPFSARIQTAALITVVMLMNNEGRKRRLSAGIHV